MAWVKMDDRFHSNPKVIQAWQQDHGSIGLYTMCLTYVAQHETDGWIDEFFVRMLEPNDGTRSRLVSILVGCGLWTEGKKGFTVNDYLDYNPSKKELTTMRLKRKAAGRKGGRVSKRKASA